MNNSVFRPGPGLAGARRFGGASRLRTRRAADPGRQMLRLPRQRKEEQGRPAARCARAWPSRAASPGRQLVPGKSAESLLYQRVTSADPDEVMPPKGERLTDEEKDIVRRWLDEGAVWPESARGRVTSRQHRTLGRSPPPVRPTRAADGCQTARRSTSGRSPRIRSTPLSRSGWQRKTCGSRRPPTAPPCCAGCILT